MSKATIEKPGTPQGIHEALAKHRCLQRTEHQEYPVGTAVFLASEDSDFITGQIITVDGGGTLS